LSEQIVSKAETSNRQQNQAGKPRLPVHPSGGSDNRHSREQSKFASYLPNSLTPDERD
jgi:hypothetical protein